MMSQTRPFPWMGERSFVFSFRTLERPDTPQIVDLHQDCQRPLAEIHELVERSLRLQEQGRGGAKVAVIDNQICAFGLLTIWPKVGEISDLIVMSEQRGGGIGSALVAELAKLGESLGVKMLEIGVFETNTRALALYERLGFVRHRSFEIRIASKPEPIIYLRKPT